MRSLSIRVVLTFALALVPMYALAANVTISGTTTFAAIDGGVDDEDHVANGVFTVTGNLTVNGTINCNDDGAGAIVSSAKTNDGNPAHGGDITVNAGGTFTQESGSTVSSAAHNSNAGAISITSGAQVTLGGYILAGPSRTISTSTIYTGLVMTGGGSQVLGGAITIKALTHNEPGLVVNGPAIIASQSGDVPSGGSVTLEAC